MTHKVHLDTDLGGDIDDLCALVMLLCWKDVEITGITTVAEAGGRRAGYVRHILEMEGRRSRLLLERTSHRDITATRNLATRMKNDIGQSQSSLFLVLWKMLLSS